MLSPSHRRRCDMADPEVSPKLAVIVYADVAGSTALVQRNETLAHQRINDAFQQFSFIIHKITWD